MPKVIQPSMPVHLWVTQGKTDHMAILEDPEILSQLNKKKQEASFNLACTSILDLVPHAYAPVWVRWSSTNQKDKVEAASIRFRDLETEGRPSRRRTRTVAAVAPTTKRKATNGRKRKRAENNNNNSKSTISSIVSKEGRDDDLSEPKGSSKQLIENGMDTKNEVSSSDDTRQDLSASQNHNPVEEDFDSSDDEAIQNRMRHASVRSNDRVAPKTTQRQTKPMSRRRTIQRKRTKRNKKTGSFGHSSATSNDSFSPSTDASSKTSEQHRKQVVVASPQQTNTTNWMKMKRFFTNFA